MTATPRTTLLAAVDQWAAAGVAIAATIPGRKCPFTPDGQWRAIGAGNEPPPDLQWVRDRIIGGGTDGIGAFCGVASGGLEMIEADGDQTELLAEASRAAIVAGIGELYRTVTTGCVDVTPSGGRHFYYRVDGPCEPNLVLAYPATGNKPAIETRGRGGWVVIAPSFGRTHPNGKPYQFVSGNPATIPTITAEQRDTLFDLFRSLCKRPPPPPAPPSAPPSAYRPAAGDRIGDRFAAETTWADVLEPCGYTFLRARETGEGFVSEWSRPGRRGLKSVVTGGRVDCLWSFSTSTPFPQRAINRYAAWVFLNFSGDFRAATAHVRHCRVGNLGFPQIARGHHPGFTINAGGRGGRPLNY